MIAQSSSRRVQSMLSFICLVISIVLLGNTHQAEARALFSDYGVRLGEQRVGVVVLDLDWSPNPTKLNSLHNVLEGEDQRPYSAQQYFDEVTHGQTRFDFDVFGVFSVESAWCDHASVAAAGNVALAQNGGDPGGYDVMLYVTEEAPAGGCRYSGGSYQGGYRAESKSIVLYGHQQPALIVHELGHHLGLKHAHSYECAAAPMSPATCAVGEYGDPTDPMGLVSMVKLYYGFNAPHKIAMGVLPPDQVKTIRRSGTYTMIGSEIAKRGTHVLKIPAAEGVFGAPAAFLVEYRQPLPAFSKSMGSEIVVTAWTENSQDPTHYVGSLNCRRRSCDALVLNQGTQTITITALYEGSGKGEVRIEFSEV